MVSVSKKHPTSSLEPIYCQFAAWLTLDDKATSAAINKENTNFFMMASFNVTMIRSRPLILVGEDRFLKYAQVHAYKSLYLSPCCTVRSVRLLCRRFHPVRRNL